MPGDEVRLSDLDSLARRWEAAAAERDAAARAWSAASAPGTAEFAARAAAALAEYAAVARAAAQRIRDYRGSVATVDDAGARSVYQAIAAAASMSTAPIEEVITTPVSKA